MEKINYCMHSQAGAWEREKNRKKAVKEAQARSLANGVPNVYRRDGVPYFQMPNGEITSKVPKEYEGIYDQ